MEDKHQKPEPPQIAAEAAVIGSAVLAWNNTQSAVHGIFWRLSRLSLAEANAVFFAPKQDSTQRDMTLALAKVTLAEHPELLCDVKTALKDLANLAGQRNAAVHTLWAVRGEALTPNPFLPRHGSLNKDNHRHQFIEMTRSVMEIGQRLVSAYNRICELFPSPDKDPQRTQTPKANS